MKLLICGDRRWNDYGAIHGALSIQAVESADELVVVTGACRGADLLAEKAAREVGLRYRGYPACWRDLGKKAGPTRNQEMLDMERPALVWAFHGRLGRSRGTRDMLRRAVAAEVPCFLFDGAQWTEINERIVA